MGDSFGTLFRVHTWGESHGGAVGAVVEGCPSGVRLDLAAIQHQLDRRRPGQSDLVTQRKETDRFEVLSGLRDGVTLGTPISLLVPNRDARPEAYEEIAAVLNQRRSSTGNASYACIALPGRRFRRKLLWRFLVMVCWTESQGIL